MENFKQKLLGKIMDVFRRHGLTFEESLKRSKDKTDKKLLMELRRDKKHMINQLISKSQPFHTYQTNTPQN